MSESLKFGIPSYNRPECKAYDTLIGLGVDNESILISLQDETQFQGYKHNHPNAQYVVRKTDCAAGNRNTIIREIGVPLVLVDDDVTSFAVNVKGTFRSADMNSLVSAISDAVEVGKQNNVTAIGVSATDNNMLLRNRPEYSFDTLLQGSLIILLKPIYFNEQWKMVEDYELCLRILSRGHTLRANHLCARKPKNGTNKGGLHERYSNGELPLWIERLSVAYPMFKPNKSKTGGQVRFG